MHFNLMLMKIQEACTEQREKIPNTQKKRREEVKMLHRNKGGGVMMEVEKFN